MDSVKSVLSYGDGYGDGSGSGSGYGYGDGSGSGYGDGSGSGSGSGYGSGYGSGISEFNGCTMHNIDGVQTIITSARGSVARGYTLGVDLQLTKCYIAKRDGLFAHGKTATDALKAVAKKAFAHLDTDSKIEEFKKTFNTTGLYPAQMFYDWHGRLTGSCEYGREQFVKDHGIALDSQMTVAEFVELTKSSYGGDIISRLF